MRLNYKKAVIIGAAGLAIIFTAPQSTLAAATGWQAVNNSWVYIDKDGGRHKGWIKTGDGYYYMDLSHLFLLTFTRIVGFLINS